MSSSAPNLGFVCFSFPPFFSPPETKTEPVKMRLESDFRGIAIYARAVICILPIAKGKHNKHSCTEQTPRIKTN
jgi:hypothetical protein